MKLLIALISLGLLSTGCTPERDSMPFDTSDDNSPEIRTIQHPDIWNAFVAFHDAAKTALSFEDIAPHLAQDVVNDWNTLDPEIQAIVFDIMTNGEQGDIHYRYSYSLDEDGSIYVLYSNVPNEAEDTMVTIDMILEDGQWRWQGANINNDEVVPSLWDADVIDQLTPYATGSVTYNGMAMPINSSLAFLDTESGEITIVLYPFVLSPNDIKAHRDGYFASGMFDKPSPNTDHWPSWSPLAMVSFYYEPGTYNYSLQNVTNSCLNLNWFEGENTFNFVCDTNVLTSTYQFQLPTQANGVFSFGLDGNAFDRDYQWSITGTTRLLNIKHIE